MILMAERFLYANESLNFSRQVMHLQSRAGIMVDAETTTWSFICNDCFLSVNEVYC